MLRATWIAAADGGGNMKPYTPEKQVAINRYRVFFPIDGNGWQRTRSI